PGNGPLRRTAVAWNVYDCAGLEFGACEEALVSGGCALADGGPWPFHPGTQRTDLNGDGYADVVIGRPFDNRVDIWCGGPAGLRSAGFIEPESCSPIGFGTTIAVGQLTGNGRASIVVGYVRCQGQQPGYFVYSNFDDSCRPLLTATREPVETRGPGAPVLSAEADIDVDGIHDLLIADGSRNLQALLGSGEALSLGTIPDGVAALRADGDLDVLTANDGQNSIAVVTSRGDATLVNDSSRFTVPRFATLGRRVVGQADGIIGVRNGQTNAVVMSSTGVTLEIPLGFSPERVMFETGDLDGDEQTDFVLGSIDMVGADGGIAVVLGASVGAPMGVLSGPGGAPLSGRFAAGGDANGDGRSDIVVSAEGKMYVVSFQEESPTYYEIGDVPPQFATQIALDF
ncbi:MAG: VCBS repeat-containing protein, partial [Myxococcota bacterium]